MSYFRAASLKTELTMNDSNSTEFVQYVRRRKSGQKRRSLIVKRRLPMNNKLNRNQSINSNENNSTINTTTIINNEDDEHSHEYQPHEKLLIMNQLLSNENEDDQTTSIIPSPRVTVTQPILKQLKIDQYLQVSQSKDNESKLNSQQNSYFNSEKINNNEMSTRRITRNTRLNSTSKSEIINHNVTISNEILLENFHQFDRK